MTLRITNAMFASIPALIAEGKDRQEIASMFGVKVGTLQVYCSKRQISLMPLDRSRRPRKSKAQAAAIEVVDDHLPAIAEAVQLVALRLEARARGTTEIGLVTRLIEMIVKDRLYDAVLGEVGKELELGAA